MAGNEGLFNQILKGKPDFRFPLLYKKYNYFYRDIDLTFNDKTDL